MDNDQLLQLAQIIETHPIPPKWTPHNEIIPGLYLGGRHTAMDIETLRGLGITHILNATDTLKPKHSELVDLRSGVFANLQMYEELKFPCKYLNLPILDEEQFEIKNYFEEAADFIHSCIDEGGKVYVHCYAGMSRSATLVIAYLMLKKGMSPEDAVQLVRYGFMDNHAQYKWKESIVLFLDPSVQLYALTKDS